VSRFRAKGRVSRMGSRGCADRIMREGCRFSRGLENAGVQANG
jgi:hypothetical protein